MGRLRLKLTKHWKGLDLPWAHMPWRIWPGWILAGRCANANARKVSKPLRATWNSRIGFASKVTLAKRPARDITITRAAKARVPNPDVMDFIKAERSEKGITAQEFSHADIVRRYMAAMVNESAKVVGEGIARRSLDVDMTLLFGYGFPRYFGGPLMWADIVGLEGMLNDIKAYGADDPDFWAPAPLLEKLVAEGRSFSDLNA